MSKQMLVTFESEQDYYYILEELKGNAASGLFVSGYKAREVNIKMGTEVPLEEV